MLGDFPQALCYHALMRVLGIDPGTSTTGYGLIELSGHKTLSLAHGVISTPPHTPIEERLVTIFQDMRTLIQEFRPQVMAIEQLFFFRNVTNGLMVSQARGVMLLAAAEAGIPIAEYTPMVVKKSIAGYGKASKQEVLKMVMDLLDLEKPPRPDDAADALAIALTHLQHVAVKA